MATREDTTLSTLGRKLEDLFVQQFDRIAFHTDPTNHYRKEEERLSKVMVSEVSSATARVEAAQAFLAQCDKYSSNFVRLLNEVSVEIDRVLLAVDTQLEQTKSAFDRSDPKVQRIVEVFERWVSRSKELQLARWEAVRTVALRVEGDRIIPTAILNSNGDISQPLSTEETSRFADIMSRVTTMLPESSQVNDRIQAERLPLVEILFGPSTSPQQPAIAEAPKIVEKVTHPLEGKPWFRFVKVFYIVLWASVAGIVAILAVIDDDLGPALGFAIVMGGGLLLARMAFYYVTLGRTTIREKPGSGYLDLNDLMMDFEKVKVENPDLYREDIEPLVTSWKSQYGRRVPQQAFQVFITRINARVEELRKQKDEALKTAAQKGIALNIADLRATMEKTKAEYTGPDREGHNRAIDEYLMKLEAQFGDSIPVDEAGRLLDEIEDQTRKQQK